MGKRIYAPYKLKITDFVKKGVNKIEVTIVTSRRNGFIGEALKGNELYKQFNKEKETTVPNGMVRPVKIVEIKK